MTAKIEYFEVKTIYFWPDLGHLYLIIHFDQENKFIRKILL